MKKVFKYNFEIKDSFKLMLSPDSNPLKVGMQNGKPAIWILIDDEDLTVETEFKVCGTGHDLKFLEEDFFFHAGSFLNDNFVWHVFQHH